MRLITVKQAALDLGLSECGFYDKNNRLHKYVSGEKGNKKFNITAYHKEIDNDFEMVEKVKMFIEYLKYEENISYKEASRISGVNYPMFFNFEFGAYSALKILRAFNFYRPYTIKRFDEYYGYKQVKNNRAIKFKDTA